MAACSRFKGFKHKAVQSSMSVAAQPTSARPTLELSGKSIVAKDAFGEHAQLHGYESVQVRFSF